MINLLDLYTNTNTNTNTNITLLLSMASAKFNIYRLQHTSDNLRIAMLTKEMKNIFSPVLLTDESIIMVPVIPVVNMLTYVKNAITIAETSRRYENLMTHTFDVIKHKHADHFIIHKFGDIVITCFNILRYRQGSVFGFIQLSSANNGQCRISVFCTDCVHHSSSAFGTRPSVVEMFRCINEAQVNDNAIFREAIVTLKKYHSTKKTVDDLLANMIL